MFYILNVADRILTLTDAARRQASTATSAKQLCLFWEEYRTVINFQLALYILNSNKKMFYFFL